MTADDKAIYENLRGLDCVCGAKKAPRKSFCRVDYFRLPVGLRNALYERDGYPETFRRALTLLELPAPTLKEESQ